MAKVSGSEIVQEAACLGWGGMEVDPRGRGPLSQDLKAEKEPLWDTWARVCQEA